jgi:hypothetical protein
MTTRICALNSCASVLRLALVAKCRQAFGEVFAANVLGKGINFRLIPVIAIRVGIGARKAFDLRKHFRALPRELQRDVLGARKKLRRGHDFVDEAPLRKLARREQPRAEKKLHRAIDGYLPKQANGGAAGRDHPVFRMTVAEFGVFRSDQNVATQKEFESSGDRRAVHGTDDRNGQRFQPRENALIVRERFNKLPAGRFGAGC